MAKTLTEGNRKGFIQEWAEAHKNEIAAPASDEWKNREDWEAEDVRARLQTHLPDEIERENLGWEE